MKAIKKVMETLDVCYFFRTMVDKPNNDLLLDYRGPGIDNGIKILDEARKTYFQKICIQVHEC